MRVERGQMKGEKRTEQRKEEGREGRGEERRVTCCASRTSFA